jgi:hypothetical protein
MTDTIHKIVQQELIDMDERVRNTASFYHRNKGEIELLARGFKKAGIEVTRGALARDHVDVCIAGDRHTLNGVFSVFRKLGYEPSSRPDPEPKPDFCCWWHHCDKEIKFWLNFTSNKCTRVEVGTEMVERKIYEVVCE